jgi:hypothetical protein
VTFFQPVPNGLIQVVSLVSLIRNPSAIASSHHEKGVRW